MNDNINNSVHFGDGVIDEAKADVNNRLNGLIKIFIGATFDFLEDKVKELPEKIKQLRNNPEIEKEITALWSEYLFEEGLVPKGYKGLPDNLLISNFHQDGYLDGLYIGYILAMMALADNDIPKDAILSVRDYIRPNLIRNHYNDKDKFISRYKDEKYNWIDKAVETD